MASFNSGDLIHDRFRLIRRLGEGGFGEVYLAEDETIARQVAIKLLKADISSDIALREARAAGRLIHPNVVTVFDVGRVGDGVFLAMEYVDGLSLDHFMDPGALSLRDRLGLLVQLCRGLAAAHQSEVIHRDIKPHNLIVDKKRTLKIVDFGIARAGGTSTILGTGMIAGSVEYMAPEQLAGQDIDHRIDIFAATVVAYELLSCTRAYPGGLSAAFRRAQTTDVPPLPQRVGRISPALDRLIRKGLSIDREQRYETADRLAEAFETIHSQLDSGRMPAGSDDTIQLRGKPTEVRADLVQTFPTPVPESDTVTNRQLSFGVADETAPSTLAVSGQRRMVIAGAAALIVVAVIGMPMMLNQRAPDTGPAASEPPAGVAPANAPAVNPVRPAATAKGPRPASRPKPTAPRDTTSAPAANAVPTKPLDAPASSAAAEPPAPAPPPPAAENPAPTPEAAAPAASPAVPRDPSLVLAVVDAYARAHRNKSAATLKTLQPSLTNAQMAAIDRAFAENAEYDFQVSGSAVAFNGSRARVTCTVIRQLSVNGERRTINRPAVFELEQRDGGSWLIASYRVAP